MDEGGHCRLLVVEDEPDMANLLRLHLHALPARVTVLGNGHLALQELRTKQPDLLVLDVHLPGLGGLELLRELRQSGSTIPVLMLTARASELDRVVGLEFGADDYMTKPFGLLELTARVRALLRRAARYSSSGDASSPRKDAPARIAFGDLRVDPERHEASLRGRRLVLKPREFELLAHFMRHPGRVFTRDALLRSVWGQTQEGYGHTVNTHINRIRLALRETGPADRYIHTVWGVGYRFAPPEPMAVDSVTG